MACANRRVVEVQRLHVRATLEHEERNMPGDVEAQIVGVRPCACVAQPVFALLRLSSHFQNVRNCVAAPYVTWREFDGAAPGVLRFWVKTFLLKGERVASHHIAR